MLSHQIPNLKLPSYPCIVHLKIGIMVDHTIFPIHFTVVHFNSHQSGCECFGCGSNLKNGVGINRIRSTQTFHTKAFSKNYLIIFHNCDCHSGHTPLLLSRFGIRFKPVQDCLNILGSWRCSIGKGTPPAKAE